jgi:L-amino acid N-acyltransferase YncA
MKLIYRDMEVSDIPALAQLHALAWKQTYAPLFGIDYSFPTAALRQKQWEDKYASRTDKWFCIVAELGTRLIGFASGNAYTSEELPQFAGELNKLYLLEEHKHAGTGKMLFMRSCERFLKNSITTMVAFTEPQNPSATFFEHMKGEQILSKEGSFHGAYGWLHLDATFRELNRD